MNYILNSFLNTIEGFLRLLSLIELKVKTYIFIQDPTKAKVICEDEKFILYQALDPEQHHGLGYIFKNCLRDQSYKQYDARNKFLFTRKYLVYVYSKEDKKPIVLIDGHIKTGRVIQIKRERNKQLPNELTKDLLKNILSNENVDELIRRSAFAGMGFGINVFEPLNYSSNKEFLVLQEPNFIKVKNNLKEVIRGKC